MSYNFRLKRFGNGTLQLVFFNQVMTCKNDLYKVPYDCDEEISDDSDYYWAYDEELGKMKRVTDTPFGLVDGWLDGLTEYSNQKIEVIELTDEELKARKERSLVSSLNRSKKNIYDYGRANVWEWFFTLTFERQEEFTAENFSECSKKVRDWFKNIRKRYCSKIKYLIVPEQHESGAWHFHALVANCKELTFTRAVNQQKYCRDNKGNIKLNKKGEPVLNKYFGKNLRTSYPDGEYIYNIQQYKNGFSTATKIVDTRKAVSYIVKYMTKDLGDCTFGKRRYLPSNNLDTPDVLTVNWQRSELFELITCIEYEFGVKMSRDCIKNVKISTPDYDNHVVYFEFGPENGGQACPGDIAWAMDQAAKEKKGKKK